MAFGPGTIFFALAGAGWQAGYRWPLQAIPWPRAAAIGAIGPEVAAGDSGCWPSGGPGHDQAGRAIRRADSWLARAVRRRRPHAGTGVARWCPISPLAIWRPLMPTGMKRGPGESNAAEAAGGKPPARFSGAAGAGERILGGAEMSDPPFNRPGAGLGAAWGARVGARARAASIST